MSKVLMPAELTAENGAKAALVGEFYEDLHEECHECGDSDYEEDPDYVCDVCGGEREHVVSVGVSWITIKAIYKKAVEHFGKDASHVTELLDALKLAVEALEFAHGGEPVPSMELEAITKVKAILDKIEGKQ